MKLFLPQCLLTALLACFALQAKAADITIDGTQSSVTAEGANITLSANWRAAWHSEYASYEYTNLMWNSTETESSPSYSMSGSGTIEGVQIYFNPGSTPATFTINNGVKLAGVKIYGAPNCTIYINSTIEDATPADGITVPTLLSTNYGGHIDIEGATLNGSIHLDITGGTVTRTALSITEGDMVTVGYGYEYGGANVFDGALTLGSGGKVIYTSYWDSEKGENTYSSLHTGSLVVSGNTMFLFSNYGADAENPAIGTVLITCDQFDPSASGAKLSELQMWSSADGVTPDTQMEELHLGYATGLNGGYEIRVVEGAPSAPTPDTPTLPETPSEPVVEIVTNGTVTTPLSETLIVELAPNGSVDVSTLQELPQKYISGSGGELVTAASQTMELSGSDNIGYNIVGADENTPGANISVGQTGGGLNDAYINLNGSTYASEAVNVLSGQLNTASGTTLGTATSLLTIGSDSASGNKTTATVNNHGTVAGDVWAKQLATMDNRGTIEGNVQLDSGAVLANNKLINGTVTVEDGARLQGSGTYNGVLVKSGGLMHVGNSPGFSSVADLTLDGNSTLSFTIDGTTAASATNSGTGTHSQLKVTNSLTVNGAATMAVEVTSGILAAGSAPFEIKLLDVSSLDAANITLPATSTSLDDALTLNLIGGENLLEAGYALVKDAEGNLVLTGSVNPSAAAALLGTDGNTIANTLWSSTSAVRAFARTATSQLSTPPHTMGDYTVWGSALGDYVSMTGFRSQAHGYAVGMDKQFCPHTRTGLAFGQMFGDFTADRGVAEVDQNSLMVGLYTEYLRELDKNNSISFTSYLAYGRTENDADTRVGGSSELPGSASWDDDTFVMGTRAEWNIRVTEKTTLTPFIGLEYMHGSQDNFTETFAGGRREYRDGSMQVWSLPVGVTARTEVSLGEQKLLPELTLAYVGDISRKNPHVRSRVYGIDNSHKGTQPGRSAFMMNVGTHWLITEDWSAGAFYNLETRSREVSQEASISVRYTF